MSKTWMRRFWVPAFLILSFIPLVMFQNCGTQNQQGSSPLVPSLPASLAPTMSKPMLSGYGCQVSIDGSQNVWLESSMSGVPQFRYRIGTAGAVLEVREVSSNKQLLGSPRSTPDYTDSVVQSVLWSQFGGVTGTPTTPPQGNYSMNDVRFNINQAGNVVQLLTPTSRVDIDPFACSVDVYAIPQDQWYPELQPNLQGTFGNYTRYQVQGKGEVAVRQVTWINGLNLLSGAKINGVPTTGAQTQFPNFSWIFWLPTSPDLPNLAMDFDSNANPTTFYTPTQYPAWNQRLVAGTRGYSTLYKPGAALNMSLVFGKKSAQCVGSPTCPTTYALNAVGVALTEMVQLATLEFGTLPVDSIVDASYVLFPSKTLTPSDLTYLNTLETELPAPKSMPAAKVQDSALATIMQNLRATTFLNQGLRTNQIGSVINNSDCSIGASGIHNTVGTPNGDPRFLCYKGRWNDCGWEVNDPSWETKAAHGAAVGAYVCDLPNRVWRSATGAKGTGNCTTAFSGFHNSVGLSNTDPRFLCFDSRWYDCGWDQNDPRWESKVGNGKVVGSYRCDLPSAKWIFENSSLTTSNCANGGIHNAVGTTNGDPRFLCFNGRWHECTWDNSDPTWETKVSAGSVVGSYRCDSSQNWVPVSTYPGNQNCLTVAGTHNTVGTPNGDPRFLCLNNRWYDCGWELNDPSWETKVTAGKRVGGFTCASGGGWTP